MQTNIPSGQSGGKMEIPFSAGKARYRPYRVLGEKGVDSGTLILDGIGQPLEKAPELIVLLALLTDLAAGVHDR